MEERKYLDEQLAKARRIFLEDQIARQDFQGVWKGEIYQLKASFFPEYNFHIHLPDFFSECKQEIKLEDDQAFFSFLVMVSANRDTFCSFYYVNRSNTYEPDMIYQMFDTLYPDHDLSELKRIKNKTLEVSEFHYISKDKTGRYYHTIFSFYTSMGQIVGHFSGELSEREKLDQMQEKILKTIEEG